MQPNSTMNVEVLPFSLRDPPLTTSIFLFRTKNLAPAQFIPVWIWTKQDTGTTSVGFKQPAHTWHNYPREQFFNRFPDAGYDQAIRDDLILRTNIGCRLILYLCLLWAVLQSQSATDHQ